MRGGRGIDPQGTEHRVTPIGRSCVEPATKSALGLIRLVCDLRRWWVRGVSPRNRGRPRSVKADPPTKVVDSAPPVHLLLALAALLSAPAAPASQVHLQQPRAYELWDGRVRGTAPPGTTVRLAARGRVWIVPAGQDGRLDALLGNVPTVDAALVVAGAGTASVY